jgi:arylsulfatase A-like enzyme/Tfp pilus assembly protein PilF
MPVPTLVFSALSAARRRLAWLAVFGILALVAAGAVRWYWNAPRPNVILVTFDTTRADRLGAYGYQQGLTEAFDDFAQRGVLFERAYAPAPITLPSHATMLTGLYPPEHGLRVNGAGKLSRDIPFLPEILKQHGYDTGAFIAAEVLDAKYGLDRGFDAYNFNRPVKKSPKRLTELRRDGEDVVNSAIAWLKGRTNRPFFCWIHLFDAHAPYDPRAEAYQQRFEENPYDAGVAWEVRQFARVTDYLKDHNLQSQTLVVVAGDHGEGLDDHLEDEHGMLVYNTTLHVPLVFAGPERYCRPGTRVSHAVSLVDLTPTLLDLLQIPAPKHVRGRSLQAALKGRPVEDRDCYAEAETPFMLNRWSPLRTVISGRWKYIQTTRPELYDLERDPGELTDLAATAEEECERLRQRLEALQESFEVARSDAVSLSDADLENLHALGYVGGGTADATSDSAAGETLPDVKDFLPYLSKYEKAKHLALEGKHTQSAAKLAEAIGLLQEIAQATRDFPLAELILGDCLAQAGQKAEAEKTYRALIARRPDFLNARFNLGRIYNEQGRFEEAAAEFRQVVEENPEWASAQFEWAQALLQLKKVDEAVTAYRAAIRLAPGYTIASLQLGRLLLQLQRPQEAQRCFEDALAHDPGSVDLRAHLMMVLVQTGQTEQAIQEGNELIAIDPNSFDARFNLGVLLLAQRRYAAAVEQFRAAQKLRPDDPRPAEQIQRANAALKR